MHEFIRKWIGSVSQNISQKHTRILLTFLSVMLFSITWIKQTLVDPNSFKWAVSIGAIITVAILFFIPPKLEKSNNKFNKIYITLIMTIGISFFLNGLYYSVIGYIAIGMLFAIIVPLTHLVVKSGNKNFFLLMLSEGIIISFIIFTIMSILFAPGFSSRQYTAFIRNSNAVGNFMIIVVAACSFLIYEKLYKNENFWFPLICMSLAIATCFFSQSRTSLLAIIGQLLFLQMILIPLFKNKYGNLSKAVVKVVYFSLILFVLIFLSISLFYFTMTTIKNEIDKVIPNIYIEDADDELDFNEMLDLSGTRFKKGIDNRSYDSFTSGRITIWNEFYQDISLLGHKDEGKNLAFRGRRYKGTNAHNVYLQVGYSAGVIAGISMLLLMLSIIKDSFIFFFRHFKGALLDSGKVFAIVASIGFFVVSLTSGGYMMYTYCPATLFWILIFNFTIETKQKGEVNYDISNWSE